MHDNRTEERRAEEQADDLENSELLLEYARASYQRHVDNFDKLDSKAATFAGFFGLILALASGLLRLASPPVLASFSYASVFLVSRFCYAGAVLFLAAAFAFCLATLKARPNIQPASIEVMIKYYRALGPPAARRRQLIKGMVKTLAEAESNRQQNNMVKSARLQTATTFLIVAFGLGMLGYFAQLFYNVGTV